MPKPRDESSGQFTEAVSNDEIVAFVREQGGVATAEVADAFDYQRPSAYRRLKELEDDGKLTVREIGNSLLWEASSEHAGRETPPEPSDDRHGEPPADDTEPREDADSAGEQVHAVVDHVASGWDDTDRRLKDRKAAARAVLAHALETGEAVGRSDAVDEFYDAYPVDGQNEETWYRKNVRPVLSAVGDYSNGAHGYRVDPERVDEITEADA